MITQDLTPRRPPALLALLVLLVLVWGVGALLVVSAVEGLGVNPVELTESIRTAWDRQSQ